MQGICITAYEKLVLSLNLSVVFESEGHEFLIVENTICLLQSIIRPVDLFNQHECASTEYFAWAAY